MARKLRSSGNGGIAEDREVECPDCGDTMLQSDLDDHDCPEDA